MVSDQVVLELLQDFNSIKPLAFVQQMDIQSMGIGNVLGFLACSGREVSAGEISEYMNVSTARVAVLLKKMSDKGLIVKKNDPNDGRRVMVSITDLGQELLAEKQNEIILYGSAVVEHFGVERVRDFIQACREIRDVVEEVKIQQGITTD
ncbi:MAG: MarR family transcriptional regulator [Clostridiales bacterium]|nr:MarR family transcriptional regulator [Clostridiales bacterium]